MCMHAHPYTVFLLYRSVVAEFTAGSTVMEKRERLQTELQTNQCSRRLGSFATIRLSIYNLTKCYTA